MGILHVGPTKSLTFSPRDRAGCHDYIEIIKYQGWDWNCQKKFRPKVRKKTLRGNIPVPVIYAPFLAKHKHQQNMVGLRLKTSGEHQRKKNTPWGCKRPLRGCPNGMVYNGVRLLGFWESFIPKKLGDLRYLEDHPRTCNVVNNHGDRFRPLSKVVPLPSGLCMAYKWGLLTTY